MKSDDKICYTGKTKEAERREKMLLFVVGNHVTFQRHDIGQRAKWNHISQILNKMLFDFIF